jgi:hypothetical protein
MVVLTAIDDLLSRKILTPLSGTVFVNPVRLIPVVMRNDAEVYFSRDYVTHTSDGQKISSGDVSEECALRKRTI